MCPLRVARAAGRGASIAALLALGSASGPLVAERAGRVFGFSEKSVGRQLALEERLRSYPSADRIRADHRHLTSEPHVAGTARDRVLAEWTAAEWRKAGLEDVRIIEHEVLLPYAEEVRVEMTAPRPWRATLREEPIDDDPSTHGDAGLSYHAYSASGEVTGPVVYAGSGNPENYDWLAAHGIDVKGKIVLVRYSVPYSYRGFKALTAQQRGAAGIIIYSDPADDGYGKGEAYPNGPWGPESHIQRGGIVYDFMVPGDPLTPGWASVAGAKRIAPRDAASLPKIVSVPMSYKEARVILEALGGAPAPPEWRGGLPIEYRVGPGAATVRIAVRNDDTVRPIWTVVGSLRGSAEPDRWVIVGNHRDAWVYGGVDPSSGSASMMELARALGAAARSGSRPKRTIVFASWDAEEWTLTSSTEWGEQFEQELREKAVAYLNVDSAAAGPELNVSAVPSLNQFVTEATDAIQDPASGETLTQAWQKRAARTGGALPAGGGDGLVKNRLGSGSDYTVFLNFVGVPIVDMGFDGPYGVYHSVYDNHQWVSRIGDPGFRYHATLTRLWAVMAARLANADLLPLDFRPYASRIGEFLTELERSAGTTFPEARAANQRLSQAAAAAGERAAAALDAQDADALAAMNRALMRVERDLLDMDGIPGRPWFRHLIYAPKYTYAPELLPGLAEAARDGDAARLRGEERRLASALDRAARTLATHNPGTPTRSGIRDPRSAIRDPLSAVRYPRSAFRKLRRTDTHA